MKSLLRKLSRADRPDRREQLEHEAAERIREVGGQAPPEAFASSWAAGATSPAPAASPAPASAAHSTAPAAAAHTPAPTASTAHTPAPTASTGPPPPATGAPAGRRLTVQERMAARELQNR